MLPFAYPAGIVWMLEVWDRYVKLLLIPNYNELDKRVSPQGRCPLSTVALLAIVLRWVFPISLHPCLE